MNKMLEDIASFNSTLPPNPNREWKEVPGYEGAYVVSNDGFVGSLSRINSMGRKVRSRLMKLHNSANSEGKVSGVGVSLHDGKSQKTFNVGRLCLMAFYGDQKDKDASYVDGNPLNNCLSNMQWKSRSEIRKRIFARKS